VSCPRFHKGLHRVKHDEDERLVRGRFMDFFGEVVGLAWEWQEDAEVYICSIWGNCYFF